MVSVEDPEAADRGVETHKLGPSYEPLTHSDGGRHLSAVKEGCHDDLDFTGASDAITSLGSASDKTSGTKDPRIDK